MRGDKVNYENILVYMIYPVFYITEKNSQRLDRVKVKVHWILFGINEDHWFSPQKPD